MSRAGGIYVHVPFCGRRCHFCAFLVTTHTDFMERWAAALVTEMDLRRSEFRDPIDTVYFGGGTPSLVPPETIGGILAAIRERCALAGDAEITLEANPGHLDAGDLLRLHDLGVTRLSLGIQSLSDDRLEFLTREHTAAEGIECFGAARAAGFTNLTIDLLYGLPGRPVEEWEEDLGRALELGPDHVSAYCLSIEPGTVLDVRRRKGEVARLAEEEERERFLLTRERLEAAGYFQYEVSSFAREPKFVSRHNEKYWTGAPYVGLGPAAHSYRDGVRSWNLGAVRNWVRALEEGRSPEEGRERPGPAERLLERLFLGLRTTAGVDLLAIREPFPPRFEIRVEDAVRAGLVTREADRLIPTPDGLVVADALAAMLAG